MTPLPATAPVTPAKLTTSPPPYHWIFIDFIDSPNELKNPGNRHGNEFDAALTPCDDTPDDPVELPSLVVPESDSDRNCSPTSLIFFGKFATSLHSFHHRRKITDGAAGPLKRDRVATGGAPHIFPDAHAGRCLPLDSNNSPLFGRAGADLIFRCDPPPPFPL
jgi:hypothetical protein